MFWNTLFGKKAWAIDKIWVENTIIYNVLEHFAWQESLAHSCNMGGKHCNLPCFGAGCLARRLELLLQYGWQTLQFTVFWNTLIGRIAWAIAVIQVGASRLSRKLGPLVQYGWETL